VRPYNQLSRKDESQNNGDFAGSDRVLRLLIGPNTLAGKPVRVLIAGQPPDMIGNINNDIAVITHT
jgi:hypothetical protein